MELLTIHMLGYAGAIIGTLSYVITQPRRILAMHAISWAFWGAYYGSLGGVSGVIVAAVGVVSCTAASIAGQQVLKKVSHLSLLVIWSVGIGMADQPIWHPVVIAPLVATTIEVASFYLRDKPIGFRIVTIFSNMAWITFGLAIGAIAGIVFGLVNILLMIVTIALISARTRPLSDGAIAD
jgi:hypothetical protein